MHTNLFKNDDIDVNTLEITPRRALFVYLKNLKRASLLANYGNLEFVSDRKEYAVVYVNEDEVESVKETLENQKYVDHVEISVMPDIERDFDKLHTIAPDNKEFD
ncbi:MAG: YlbG family protein [Lactobacillales bacterium]|jgi:uncharacterized protein YlbG (UPF0298 family)|nr:YlbG family protein [Lactobacillales bacterium]